LQYRRFETTDPIMSLYLCSVTVILHDVQSKLGQVSQNGSSFKK